MDLLWSSKSTVSGKRLENPVQKHRISPGTCPRHSIQVIHSTSKREHWPPGPETPRDPLRRHGEAVSALTTAPSYKCASLCPPYALSSMRNNRLQATKLELQYSTSTVTSMAIAGLTNLRCPRNIRCQPTWELSKQMGSPAARIGVGLD